jgi:uncharacterized protein (TIGR02246 family)
MKKTITIVVALCAMVGCQTGGRVDIAADTDRLKSVMDEINRAWETEDIELFSRIVAHDADLVSFGSDVNDQWIGWEALRKGLEEQFAVFSDTRVTPHRLDVHVSKTGQVAWLAQAMAVSTRFFDSPLRLEARITSVFEKRDAEWKLVQFHYSVPISESRGLGI